MGWSGDDEQLREVYREIAHYIVVTRDGEVNLYITIYVSERSLQRRRRLRLLYIYLYTDWKVYDIYIYIYIVRTRIYYAVGESKGFIKTGDIERKRDSETEME